MRKFGLFLQDDGELELRDLEEGVPSSRGSFSSEEELYSEVPSAPVMEIEVGSNWKVHFNAC